MWNKKSQEDRVRCRMQRRRHPNVCEVGEGVRVCSAREGESSGVTEDGEEEEELEEDTGSDQMA